MDFFDELRIRIEHLHKFPERDNEATRHDQLIYPLLTNNFGLGWHPKDIISQSTINIPDNVSESHIFRGAIPKIRKPDLLICPQDIIRNIVVIEEKNRQTDIKTLGNHRLQLSEYQSLYGCNWGILTDGEKWLIKKGFETMFEFSSVDEIQKNINEFKNILGREAMLERFNTYNSFDLVILSPVTSWTLPNFPEYNNIPTVVVGVDGLTITTTGRGFKEYQNFQQALIDFPDLHPKLNTKRFTWGMKEIKDDKLVKLRFETWKAYDFYST
jgi:hypothetical protein